ncbi:hypothetical protein Ahy_B02g059655 [Arachis hypogaea]|uniref:DUF4283 domain-containing protein n=1 Tax=Arachis hypogaea TaxID=3818 RepID=A0A445AH26_ARAHY|nr:hypothetical protein Ahy_B02g059655 [Arachis hypogaea]
MSTESLSSEVEKRSPEEEDLVARSTKKVKMDEFIQEENQMEDKEQTIEPAEETMEEGHSVPEEEVGVQETIPEQATKASYKDRLISNGLDKLNPEEIVDMVAEDYLSEEDLMESEEDEKTPFNPMPKIEVTLEEYDQWCRPWKQSLIVKPLGKKLNLPIMERWVNRRWSKKGAVHVMDLEGGYFLIRFSDQGDYAHAFFERPWMIADHYLLIQRWRPLFIPKENEVQKGCPDENKKGQKETRLDQQNHHAAAGDLPAQNTSEQIPIPNQKGKEIVMEKNHGAGLEEKAVANNEQSSEIFTKNKVADTSKKVGSFGPWMIVKKPQRRNKQRSGEFNEEKKKAVNANRFGILVDEENNQETNMEKQDIANLDKKEGGNQTSKEDQQGGRVEASLKLQGAGNKKNIFNKANKGKNTENSRKRIKDVQQPLAPKREKEHNHKEGSRKQDKEHQEYWNQFNNLLKGIYKSHQQGNHIDFNEPFNPLLSNLIAKTMGGGRPEGESSGTLKDKPPEINQDEYMNMIMDGRHDKQPVQIPVGEDEEEEYGPKPMDD